MNYRKSWKELRNLLLSVAIASNASAMTVDDALIAAYENNYQLMAEASNYDAAKTNVPKALSGFLPRASFQRSDVKTKYKTPIVAALRPDRKLEQDTLTFTQPIFNGGGTVAQTGAAWHSMQGEFYTYRATMNQVSMEAVSAYENVLATEEIYKINTENERNFKQYLDYTKIRFEAGVVTKTDVLQSEVQLAQATANKQTAYANMMNTKATLQKTIGYMPEENMEPIDLRKIAIPKDVAEFRALAFDANPNIKAADANQSVAKYNLGSSASAILPSVNFTAEKVSSNAPKNFNNPDSSTYALNLSIPIFQSGAEYADIAQKAYLKEKSKYDYLQSERVLEETVITYWNNYTAAKYSLQFRKEGVDAARLALEGVKEEVKVGTKTTIDLLNAESDYFNAKVALRTTQRDLVVASYQILQIMGQLDVL